MKKQAIIVSIALAVTAISFGQKREVNRAQRAIKSEKYSDAQNLLNEAEKQITEMDDKLKAQFYAARAEVLTHTAGQDYNKMKTAAEAIEKAKNLDSRTESQLEETAQNLRAALINSAVRDQNSGNYEMASRRLATSYQVSQDPSDLYFAAGNAVNGNDYDLALQYYQQLLDLGYTGEETVYVATSKSTGEVEHFDNKNLRDMAVRSGEYIKPETQKLESRKGEILRNMTLIYIDKNQTEKATELMKQARAENPSDIFLMRAEADMSYKMGDLANYNRLLNEIVASDPDNPEVYFNLGVGTAEIGETEKAITYYEKALELKPDYEGALINIAVVKLAGEKELVDEMNSLGTSAADNRRYDQLLKEREELYKETLPYLERALEINPKNIEVVTTLRNIHSQLGNDDKFEEMKSKLEALEQGE